MSDDLHKEYLHMHASVNRSKGPAEQEEPFTFSMFKKLASW